MRKAKDKKPLRVGFDLDGVLLYNPARTIRPMVAMVKKLFKKQKKTTFYVPQSKPSQLLFHLLHKSSFMLAPGFDQIRILTQEKLIEPHIITARFDYLKHDFHNWLDRINAKDYFVSWQHNSKNEQPHVYKSRAVKQLELDVFVEDNWDIVQHINQYAHHPKPKVIWVTNLIDNSLIDYPHKQLSLKSAINSIKQMINPNN